MTVIDTSAVVDFLLGVGVMGRVQQLMEQEGELAAPDLLVFETLAVIRRQSLRGSIAGDRASGAVDDLGDLPVELFPSLPLRRRAWELRSNLTAADALFVALAERLGEPLATKDAALAAAASEHAAIDVLSLVERR
ncbi:MAG TPA: type II toxin-antitoxin system VapC family toxin [Solirubrobacteraceae bacterium]|nr:type II toxin-antitoxin system VapC family toxin [Solirubrobacteraceae bacterium]